MTLTEAIRRHEGNDWGRLTDEPMAWSDADFGSLEDLRDCWRLGRKLARYIRACRAAGQPFEEDADLLRQVKKTGTKRLMAWQPAPQQRQRPN